MIGWVYVARSADECRNDSFNDGVNFDVVTFDAQRVWPNADAVVARCAVAA